MTTTPTTGDRVEQLAAKAHRAHRYAFAAGAVQLAGNGAYLYGKLEALAPTPVPVSYTHLTLPTIA